MATVFENIMSGLYPGSFVHQDDLCVAFMDLHPINAGHVLVVPREAVERLSELDPKVAGHLFLTAQSILAAIETSSIRCNGANIFLSDGKIAGQEVPHVHLHIVPRYEGDGVKISFGKPFTDSSRPDLDAVAATISAAMES